MLTKQQKNEFYIAVALAIAIFALGWMYMKSIDHYPQQERGRLSAQSGTLTVVAIIGVFVGWFMMNK